jgi:uncharacterized protein YdhG (YjbR/CyaY superfamily)
MTGREDQAEQLVADVWTTASPTTQTFTAKSKDLIPAARSSRRVIAASRPKSAKNGTRWRTDSGPTAFFDQVTSSHLKRVESGTAPSRGVYSLEYSCSGGLTPTLELGHARRHAASMTKMDTHDAYIGAAPEQFRPLLGQLRAQLSRALPDAEEVVKYDMPGFQIEGTIIAGYAAFSKQCGLYVDPGAIAAHADEIASLKLKTTKTGVTFSVSKPITDELVEKLAVSSRSKKGF